MDTDFSDLSALYLNCTLKRSPEQSHTEGLLRVSMDIMQEQGVHVELLRPVDYTIAHGVYPDMTNPEDLPDKAVTWNQDDWPDLQKKVMDADILVIGTPIWLGEKSSVCTQVIERLYANSAKLNDNGQYAYYGRTGGCLNYWK